jgi:hypothetical protein
MEKHAAAGHAALPLPRRKQTVVFDPTNSLPFVKEHHLEDAPAVRTAECCMAAGKADAAHDHVDSGAFPPPRWIAHCDTIVDGVTRRADGIDPCSDLLLPPKRSMLGCAGSLPRGPRRP